MSLLNDLIKDLENKNKNKNNTQTKKGTLKNTTKVVGKVMGVSLAVALIGSVFTGCESINVKDKHSEITNDNAYIDKAPEWLLHLNNFLDDAFGMKDRGCYKEEDEVVNTPVEDTTTPPTTVVTPDPKPEQKPTPQPEQKPTPQPDKTPVEDTTTQPAEKPEENIKGENEDPPYIPPIPGDSIIPNPTPEQKPTGPVEDIRGQEEDNYIPPIQADPNGSIITDSKINVDNFNNNIIQDEITIDVQVDLPEDPDFEMFE